MADATAPLTIDAYIAVLPPEARDAFVHLRRIVHEEAVGASETISYRMPAFVRGGIVVYLGAFKRHIGVFPPVRGDAGLTAALAPYRGPNGNLKFPLDQPMPHELFRRVVQARLAALSERAAKTRTPKPTVDRAG